MSESVSEFFDAQEVLLSASSSENEASDDESYISDVSDNISEDNTSVADNISRQSRHPLSFQVVLSSCQVRKLVIQ